MEISVEVFKGVNIDLHIKSEEINISEDTTVSAINIVINSQFSDIIKVLTSGNIILIDCKILDESIIIIIDENREINIINFRDRNECNFGVVGFINNKIIY